MTVFGKGDRTRSVLLPERAWKALQALRNGTGPEAPVFVSRKKRQRLTTTQIWRIVQAAAESRVVAREEKWKPEPGADDAPDGPTQLLAEACRIQTLEPQRVTAVLAELAQRNDPRHLVLLGEPGDGKTTLLYKRCVQFADEGLCPIFLTACDIETMDSLEDYIAQGNCLRGSGIPAAWGKTLWEKFCNGQAPLLVDGLDEVNDRAAITEKILQVASGAGRKATILVTFHTYFCQGREQDVEEAFALECLRQVTAEDRWQAYRGQERAILDDIVVNAGLLAQDGVGRPYRFFHPTFQEYFAARFLAARWDADDPAYQAWLPREEGWQLQEPEFRCPKCQCLLPSFREMLFRPEYRELLLLFVGLLRSNAREQTFLDGITGGPLEICVFPTGERCRVWLDDKNRLQVRAKIAVGFVEQHVLYEDLSTLWEFALHAISRCRSAHAGAVRRALDGLIQVPWLLNHWEAPSALRPARCHENAAAAAKNFLLLLQREDPWVRARAAGALGQLGVAGEEVVRALVEALRDENDVVRA